MNRTISAMVIAALAMPLLLSACGAKPTVESATPSVSPSLAVVSPTPSVVVHLTPSISPTQTVSPTPRVKVPSVTPTPVPSPVKTVAVNGKYPIVVEAGNAVLADLDSDGEQDEVYFECDSEFSFCVNGTEYAEIAYDRNISFEPDYGIVDVDTSDNLLEIAIMVCEASDYDITCFYRYDGNEFKYIGYVRGYIINSRSNHKDIKFNGDGTISSFARWQALQYWFFDIVWKLSESDGFERVPQELYYPNSDDGCNATLLVEIPVYENNDTSSTKTVLTVGTSIKLIATDNNEWVLAETSDKKQFWIHLNSEEQWEVETINGYDFSGNVFSGINIAT